MPEHPLAEVMPERLRLHLHLWAVVIRALWMQVTKRRGGGCPPLRIAWYTARCCGWVAAGQHLGHRNPTAKRTKGETDA